VIELLARSFGEEPQWALGRAKHLLKGWRSRAGSGRAPDALES
jgi:hypothetical protein